MGGEWRELQRAAHQVDRLLKGMQPDGSVTRQFRTLVHGGKPGAARWCMALSVGQGGLLGTRVQVLLTTQQPRPPADIKSENILFSSGSPLTAAAYDFQCESSGWRPGWHGMPGCYLLVT